MRERLTASRLRAAELQPTRSSARRRCGAARTRRCRWRGRLRIAVKEGGRCNMAPSRRPSTTLVSASARAAPHRRRRRRLGGRRRGGRRARPDAAQRAHGDPRLSAAQGHHLQPRAGGASRIAGAALAAHQACAPAAQGSPSQNIANDLLSASVLGVLVNADAPPQLREEALPSSTSSPQGRRGAPTCSPSPTSWSRSASCSHP